MRHRPYLKQIDQQIERPNPEDYTKAVFILHDQLNLEVWPEWIRKEKPLLIFVESEAKGRSRPYHKKKLIYVLSSMRHFALECARQGFPVLYHSTEEHYDDALKQILSDHSKLKLSYMTPSEWDSRERLTSVKEKFRDRCSVVKNRFFLADAEEFSENITRGYRMEFFYREMRKKTGYLMHGESPEGEEWNYDDQNRKKLPKNIEVPDVQQIEPDEVTQEVIDLVNDQFNDHFGNSSEFRLAVTRSQAQILLDEFIEERLDDFGPYEDAMSVRGDTLFHSKLSVYLNNGLLLPAEICDKVQEAYNEGKVKLNSAEGMIRQVIGWREFVRIYYEAMMPDVRNTNHFNFKRALPEMYWTGKTKMNCMKECLKPVIQDGYSHHIPRLMVLSNFSNLTETDPRLLNEWFWLAYVDAYEWVVLPNVLGMSTFADGGILASKPYIAGGNYINKMSDFCKDCAYSIKEKTGKTACPFNYLYWNFVDQERETMLENGRANFMVNLFDKRSDQDKKEIRESSRQFIEELKRM